MKRRNFLGLTAAALSGAAIANPSVLHADFFADTEEQKNTGKELNPKTKWLREARWGFFTHYLPHMPSDKVPDDMTGKRWNKKVNSFRVSHFGDQLSEIKAPYFFITIGQGGGYYCAPNSKYESVFGPAEGRITDRDLVAELAADLIPRGIKMCVYLSAKRGMDSIEQREAYLRMITEWSERWGDSISAWWIDGGVLPNREMYQDYAHAFKAGNKDALLAFNTGPIGMTKDLKKPATDLEDYLAGETNWHLPVSGYRPWDQKEYYLGPNISGDQLHFLTFLGSFWGTGDPRFPDELVLGWTKHTNLHGGTISWDVPLHDNGIIPDKHFNQLKVLSKFVQTY
jgi:hypothetical protein